MSNVATPQRIESAKTSAINTNKAFEVAEKVSKYIGVEIKSSKEVVIIKK